MRIKFIKVEETLETRGKKATGKVSRAVTGHVVTPRGGQVGVDDNPAKPTKKLKGMVRRSYKAQNSSTEILGNKIVEGFNKLFQEATISKSRGNGKGEIVKDVKLSPGAIEAMKKRGKKVPGGYTVPSKGKRLPTEIAEVKSQGVLDAAKNRDGSFTKTSYNPESGENQDTTYVPGKRSRTTVAKVKGGVMVGYEGKKGYRTRKVSDATEILGDKIVEGMFDLFRARARKARNFRSGEGAKDPQAFSRAVRRTFDRANEPAVDAASKAQRDLDTKGYGYSTRDVHPSVAKTAVHGGSNSSSEFDPVATHAIGDYKEKRYPATGPSWNPGGQEASKAAYQKDADAAHAKVAAGDALTRDQGIEAANTRQRRLALRSKLLAKSGSGGGVARKIRTGLSRVPGIGSMFRPKRRGLTPQMGGYRQMTSGFTEQERFGYAICESFNNLLNELSTKTLKSYQGKAIAQMRQGKKSGLSPEKMAKRGKMIHKAGEKIKAQSGDQKPGQFKRSEEEKLTGKPKKESLDYTHNDRFDEISDKLKQRAAKEARKKAKEHSKMASAAGSLKARDTEAIHDKISRSKTTQADRFEGKTGGEGKRGKQEYHQAKKEAGIGRRTVPVSKR